MKQFSIGLLLLFVGFAAQAQSKIGTIDAEYILAQMPESTDINKQLEDYNKELQGELQNTINDYQTAVKDYQASNDTLTDASRKEKQAKIVELENDIKNFRQKASVMIQMKRNELSGPLYEKIDAAMQKVIADEGYTQIFHAGAQGLAYSRAEDDITERVMKLMGVTPKPAPQAADSTAQNK